MSAFFDKLFGRKQGRPRSESKIPAPNATSESFQPYQIEDVIAGKFQVCRVIGRGGFGVVYHVRFLETGENFALKTFKDEVGADGSAAEAFKKEALVWVNLQRHPYILPAIWVDGVRYGSFFRLDGDQKLTPESVPIELPGRLFVVMELVKPDSQGRVTLDDYLRSGLPDPEQMLTWGIQFCYGMEHARTHGIECHRDIKPANIMITSTGTVKVSDFGLAIATESALRSANHGYVFPREHGRFSLSFIVNGTRALCGTPGYIAPEIYRAEGATVQSDIYSFGLVLWQMVNRSPTLPFTAPWNGNIEDYLRCIYQQQISGHVPLSNDAMGRVIERCLRSNASDRYSTFKDLRSALELVFERCTGQKFEKPNVGGESAAFWNNKGASLAALRQYDEAIRCYDAALTIDPRSYKTWNNKGAALSALGRSDEALECFNRSLSIEPRFSMASRNIDRELLLRTMKGEGR